MRVYARGVTAVFGLLVSLSLALSPLIGTSPVCSGRGACLELSLSAYGRFAGVPTAWYGVAFYAFMLVLLWLSFERTALVKVAQVFAAAGGLISLILLFTLRFKAGVLCELCIGSAAICGLQALAYVEPDMSSRPTVRQRNLLWTVLCLQFVVFGALSVAFAKRPLPVIDAVALKSVSEVDMRSAGLVTTASPSGKSVVVWTDHTCSACHSIVPQLIKQARNGTGAGLYVRNFPLDSQGLGAEAAELGEAFRARGIFASFVSAISREKPATQADLRALKLSLEDDKPLSLEELNSARIVVSTDVRLAKKLKIGGTPVILLCESGRPCREIGLKDALAALAGE